MNRLLAGVTRGIALAAVLALLPAAALAMEGKLGVQLLGMIPRGEEAERYSDTGAGVGFQLVAPFSRTMGHVAAVVGLEWVGMRSVRSIYLDPRTLQAYQVSTDQYFGRFSLGLELGSHGRGLLRPHVGADVALDFYGILTETGASDPGSGSGQFTQADHHAVFGYGATVGLDVNPWNTVSFDAGVRLVQSFDVPQLSFGAEHIQPKYLQIYLGVGFDLPWLGKHVSD